MVIDGWDREQLFVFIKGVTGNVHEVESREEYFVRVAERLIKEGGHANVSSYLEYLSIDSEALNKFINATTNHTTSWFREINHFRKLEKNVLKYIESTRELGPGRPVFKVMSIGCASGQEVYSIALQLEAIRRENADFNYQVTGLDIDSECLVFAKRAIYPMSGIKKIPDEFHSLILFGSGKTEGQFTLDREIRRRCRFNQTNLVDTNGIFKGDTFDAIFIRNVLFYFGSEDVIALLNSLDGGIKDNGSLFVGHSEVFLVSGQSYAKSDEPGVFCKNRNLASTVDPKRILVIEDSKTVQAVLERILAHRGFRIDCVNSKFALENYLKTRPTPDIISLDLHMPGFEGEDWLRKFRATNVHTPVVVISSLFAEDARPVVDMLATGAQDYVEKSKLDTDPELVGNSFNALLAHGTSNCKLTRTNELTSLEFSPELILIGASTGGIKALRETLRSLPSSSAPILIVQHIAPNFGKELAGFLARITGLEVGTTDKTTQLERGHLYIATGDYHIAVRAKDDKQYVVPRHYPDGQFRPSVDVLFNSVSTAAANKSISILLTGMGKDGVEGMGKLKRHGGITIAQDYASSAVHGMPGEAIKAGYATYVTEPRNIRELLFRCAANKR